MSYIQRRAESTTKTQHKNKLSYGITSLVRYSSSHLLVLLCTTDKTGGGQATVGERRRASDVHSKYSSSTCSCRLHTHFSNYMISINSRIAVYNQHERWRASEGGRATGDERYLCTQQYSTISTFVSVYRIYISSLAPVRFLFIYLRLVRIFSGGERATAGKRRHTSKKVIPVT